ncbi:MAG: alpha/beta family hydrolase, partial [Candidatus Acidiferrales bacterium]
RVQALLGVGIPANDSDFSYLASCAKPKLVVQGSRDQYGSRENVEALLARTPDPKKLVWIDSADHFLAGKLDELRKAITANLPAFTDLELHRG